jgi:hypothetical protein
MIFVSYSLVKKKFLKILSRSKDISKKVILIFIVQKRFFCQVIPILNSHFLGGQKIKYPKNTKVALRYTGSLSKKKEEK